VWAAAKRTLKYTVSLVDTRIDNYKGTLETLRRNLIDQANVECSVITHHVLDVVTEVRKCFLYVFGQILLSKMVNRGLASAQRIKLHLEGASRSG
jgi:hypothetical protein